MRARKERRLAALAEAVALYEAEFGEITSKEMDAQSRADRRTVRRTNHPRRHPTGGARR